MLAADTQPEMEDWMAEIKQVVVEDRLKRRRTKGQSVVVAGSSDGTFVTYNDSGLSYKNRIDSGT